MMRCRKSVTSSGAFPACRLIPLDKNSGLRLIHVTEVLQQIADKVIVTHPRGDILTSVGFLQVFTGHKVEYESLIHAMLTIYEEQSAEAVLLVKGSSAFNSVNRNAFSHKVGIICPANCTVYEKLHFN